jgi:hypothetical protein
MYNEKKWRRRERVEKTGGNSGEDGRECESGEDGREWRRLAGIVEK